MDLTATLQQLGVSLTEYAGPDLAVRSPIDGAQLTSLRCHSQAAVEASIAQAAKACLVWRDVPSPQRGRGHALRRVGTTCAVDAQVVTPLIGGGASP
jgi:acyl-CoA reductase-like NAD-dependent aldehyde dehydrogenase